MPRNRTPHAACPGHAALALASGLLLVSCDKPPAPDPRTQSRVVRSVLVTARDGAGGALTGTVRARFESDLGFRVAGKVAERLVDAGAAVRRGQMLMRLDPIDLRLQRAATEAQLDAALRNAAAARAQSVRATADEARLRALVRSADVSRQAYEQAKATADADLALLAAAQAQADAARAAANAMRRQADYAVLTADADGVVMATSAEPGQVVTAGQPVLKLAMDGPREAVVNVPEGRATALPKAARATLYGAAGSSAAHLRYVSAAADPLTRTYEARYIMDGEAARAPLGSTVTLDFPDQASDALSIPLAAIFDAGAAPNVWVIDTRTLSLSSRPVIVARMSEETAEITGGLRAGERIVALGPQLLHAGERVRLEQGL